uniref:Uncharacterized protein n=1 Tax=Arundo donax TaxID=35708 RepID=A0A0A9H3U8_ARUDO
MRSVACYLGCTTSPRRRRIRPRYPPRTRILRRRRQCPQPPPPPRPP